MPTQVQPHNVLFEQSKAVIQNPIGIPATAHVFVEDGIQLSVQCLCRGWHPRDPMVLYCVYFLLDQNSFLSVKTELLVDFEPKL